MASTAPMPAAEAPTITYFAIYGFTSLNTNASLGQLATHAGSSKPWHKSHLATTWPSLSIFMAPYGQTIMQVQQPMHFSLLWVTWPVFSSFCIAPDKQAVTHGASSQWRHWMANETGLFTSSCYSAYWFGAFAVVGFDYVF